MARISRWAGHAVKQTGWNPGPRAAWGGLALVGAVALLAAFYLAVSSQTAVLGRRLEKMEEDQAMILHENAHLRDQIARASSMATMSKRALDAHFVTTGTVRFLSIAFEQVLDLGQSQELP